MTDRWDPLLGPDPVPDPHRRRRAVRLWRTYLAVGVVSAVALGAGAVALLLVADGTLPQRTPVDATTTRGRAAVLGLLALLAVGLTALTLRAYGRARRRGTVDVTADVADTYDRRMGYSPWVQQRALERERRRRERQERS